MNMNLETLYNIIFSIICNYCHCYYDVDEYLNLNELEDQLADNDFIIDEDFLDSIIKSLNSVDKLSNLKIKYVFKTEDYWLDAEESILVKYLVIQDSNYVELYRIAMDEFNNYHSITIFIRILLYVYESLKIRSEINNFLPHHHFT